MTTSDDQRFKVRHANGTLTSVSDMLTIGSSGVTLAQVNGTVAAAIAAVVSGAPDAMNTLAEISASLNDNDSAYATLLSLIQATNPLLTFPSSAISINLLSGSNMRALQATRIASLVESSDRVLLTVNGVSSDAFTAYNTQIVGWLTAKQDTLTSGSSVGQAILVGSVVKRIRFYGNGVNTTSDVKRPLNTAGNESVVAMSENGGVINLTVDGYAKSPRQKSMGIGPPARESSSPHVTKGMRHDEGIVLRQSKILFKYVHIVDGHT